MAYNLQSLITILEQILHPKQKRWILGRKKPQLKSLHDKVASLQQILEKCPLTKIESLESQIKEAAHKAEDMIESNMVDQMLSNPKGVSFTFSTPDLRQVTKGLDSVMQQVVKLIKEKTMSSGSSSRGGAALSHDLSSKSIGDEDSVQSKAVVGVDADLTNLKDRLMRRELKLEIVPIVGMGGIGKTTLARKLYEDPSIVEHFTYLAWTTVSQDYNMQAILLSLLRCIIGKECDQHTGKETHELKDILYRSLYSRRYMIVLDDIWSTNFWDEIKDFFPPNDNGSRIVLTTRESDVAKRANSHSKQHEMQLLNESESWNLLRQEAFGDEEDCPVPLRRIGRDIARNCGGLPLAICVIGGLLSKANQTQEFWKSVANDVTAAAVAETDGQFSDILSLSYSHLPSHLRPCFLYMGAFPEDYEIKASRLVRLWVAEGFLKSTGDKSLEEEAEDCLKALVDRNLVSVRAVNSSGRPKSYGMHDLMRDLCLKKVEQHRFVHISNRPTGVGEVEGIRRVSIQPSRYNLNLFYTPKSMSLARSFLCTGHTECRIRSGVLLAQRLLRVLDLLEIQFQQFPTKILQILNLRYLALSSGFNAQPFDISRLCNLQTLVISSSTPGRTISLPCEILRMAELRHVMVYNAKIKIQSCDWTGSSFILQKLQTIFSIHSSHDFLHRIPNLMKLGIEDGSSIFDLYHLEKLETLKFYRGYGSTLISSSTLKLPVSLKKLSLTICKIVGEFMNYLCELPNLEVLKLLDCDFEDGEPQEWDATEQEFCTLKYLLLDGVKLVKWQADETNFPVLRHLVIRYCLALEEIPSGIGEIMTLQTIELVKCRPSLVTSAKRIIKEHRENGNNDLRLRM